MLIIDFGDIVIELYQYGGYDDEVNFTIPYESLKNATAQIVGEAAEWFLEWYEIIKPIVNAYCGTTYQSVPDRQLMFWAEDNIIPPEINLIAKQAFVAQVNRKERERRRDLETNTRRAYKADGYVYLARSTTGHYKIGVSKNPEKRIDSFGAKMPIGIEHVYSFKADNMYNAENQLHKRFQEKRVTGEWFDLTPEDVAYIQSISSFADGRFVTA